jgi:hypothetical protein
MDGLASQLALLLDLDARHEELLERVSDLDQRVAKTLREWTMGRKAAENVQMQGGRAKAEE